MQCPKCKSENVLIQRDQTGNIGASTNRVVIQEPKKRRGCLYWLCCGWIFSLMYWITIGWWWNLFFGGKNRSGFNFGINKSINKTVAICQNCGHTWKV